MLKYLSFWVLFHTLGLLPLRLLYPIASFAGALGYRLASGARRNVEDNLRHVMPEGTPDAEVSRAAKHVFQNIALYYADLAHLPRMDVQQFFDKRLKVFGLQEYLLPAVKEGNGVIVLSGHMGNPELAVQGLIPVGVKAVALTEPQDPPQLSRMMDRYRRSKGHMFGPVNMANVKLVLHTLKRGGVVALMGDRDIHGPKQRLPFFGTETLMPTGPIEVALKTGATVITCFTRRRDKYCIEATLEEPLPLERTGDFQEDVRRGALAFLERMERRLKADPGQWAVLESIWDTAHEMPAVPAPVGGQH